MRMFQPVSGNKVYDVYEGSKKSVLCEALCE